MTVLVQRIGMAVEGELAMENEMKIDARTTEVEEILDWFIEKLEHVVKLQPTKWFRLKHVHLGTEVVVLL